MKMQGQHTTESHVHDTVTRLLSVPLTADVQQMVLSNPMSNTTTLRHGLELLSECALCTSQSFPFVITSCAARSGKDSVGDRACLDAKKTLTSILAQIAEERSGLRDERELIRQIMDPWS